MEVLILQMNKCKRLLNSFTTDLDRRVHSEISKTKDESEMSDRQT